MKKIDYAEKMKQLGKQVKSQPRSYAENTIDPIPVAVSNSKPFAPKEKARKLCPVTGDPCNSICKWFRFNKTGHNCPIPEILAISWKLNNIEIILTAFAKKFLEGFEEGEQKEK